MTGRVSDDLHDPTFFWWAFGGLVAMVLVAVVVTLVMRPGVALVLVESVCAECGGDLGD